MEETNIEAKGLKDWRIIVPSGLFSHNFDSTFMQRVLRAIDVLSKEKNRKKYKAVCFDMAKSTWIDVIEAGKLFACADRVKRETRLDACFIFYASKYFFPRGDEQKWTEKDRFWFGFLLPWNFLNILRTKEIKMKSLELMLSLPFP